MATKKKAVRKATTKRPRRKMNGAPARRSPARRKMSGPKAPTFGEFAKRSLMVGAGTLGAAYAPKLVAMAFKGRTINPHLVNLGVAALGYGVSQVMPDLAPLGEGMAGGGVASSGTLVLNTVMNGGHTRQVANVDADVQRRITDSIKRAGLAMRGDPDTLTGDPDTLTGRGSYAWMDRGI